MSKNSHKIPPQQREISAIYEFKISMCEIKPLIWRLVQVPKEFNFEELHFAIQAAMGWRCYHLHSFKCSDPADKTKNVEITDPETAADRDYYGGVFGKKGKNLTVKATKIADFFKEIGDKAVYEYDFGDGWEHNVVLEKILPVEPETVYPKVIAGERACPPEGEQLLDFS